MITSFCINRRSFLILTTALLLIPGTAIAQPVFSKAFSAPQVIINEDVTLTFTFDNSGNGVAAINMAFTDVLPVGLEISSTPNLDDGCLFGTLTANAGSDTITYTGGSVAAAGVCTIDVDITGIAFGTQNNVSGDLTSSQGNSGPATADIDVVPVSLVWNNIGSGDYLDSGNWTPAAVPDLTTDALINNGGTARISGGNSALARNLFVGTDGGEGTLILSLDVASPEIEVAESLNLGFTSAGTSNSIAMVHLESSSLRAFNGGGGHPLRMGVTTADGDATFTLLTDRSFRVDGEEFSEILMGVSDGAGQATADFQFSDFGLRMLIEDSPRIELGVSHSTGHALVQGGIDRWFDNHEMDMGVANAEGNATVDLLFRNALGGATAPGNRGPAQIGVSHGSGTAMVTLAGLNLSTSLNALGPYTQIDIGIANSTGDATANLELGSAMAAETVNIGISNGSGVGSADIFLNKGLSVIPTLTLGSGSALTLRVGGVDRATDGSHDFYTAFDVGTAVLDGDLALDFQTQVPAAQRFEFFNSASVDGLSGGFGSFSTMNLNQGYTALPSIVVDGGLEKYVVDLTGAMAEPSWVNPGDDRGSGDWFTPSNWDTGIVPGSGDPTVIANGGTAVVDNTAPMSPEVWALYVGRNGGNGTLTIDSTDVRALREISIGRIDPGVAVGGVTTGLVNLSNASLLVPAVEHSHGNVFEDIFIGHSLGTGMADGTLNIQSGDVFAANTVHIGAAFITDVGGLPVANGTLEILGDGPDITQINAGKVRVGVAESENIDGTATSTASLTMRDLSWGTDLDTARSDADLANTSTSAIATVIMENVELSGRFGMDIGDSEATEPGTQTYAESNVMFSNAIIDIRDPDGELTSIIEVCDSEADEDGVSECNGEMTFDASELNVSTLRAGSTDTDNEGSTTLRSIVRLINGTTAEVNRFEIAEGESDDTAVTHIEGTLIMVDSTLTAMDGTTFVGEWEDESSEAGNQVVARLLMESSMITATEIEVGFDNEFGKPMEASVIMNPSLIVADLITMGPDGSIRFGVEGDTRVTAGTIGDPDTYSALDAADALLDGEIIAHFDFIPPPGTHTYDLIITDSLTALDDSTATFVVDDLPDGFTVDSFGVVEDGTDIVRLVISGASNSLFMDGFEF